MKVLIADQNKEYGALLQRCIESDECEVFLVSDGQGALEKILSHKPDVVVSEVVLPSMDGYRLCRSLKRIDHLRHIPFILHTMEFAGDDDLMLARDVGVRDVIKKPADPREFMKSLKRLAAERSQPTMALSFSDIRTDIALTRRIEERLAPFMKGNMVNDSLTQYDIERLVKNLPGMLYRCMNDKNWTMKYVSAGCSDLTGYPVEDIVENRTVAFGDLISHDDREYVWNEVQSAIKEERAFFLTYRITTNEGEIKVVMEQGQLVSGEGKSAILEGYIWDATKEYVAEEQRKRFFEIVIDILVVSDVNGYIKQCSQSMTRVLGWGEAEIIDQEWSKFVHEGDREKVARAKSKLASGQKVVEFEHRCLCRDGSYRILSWNAFPALEEGLIYAVARDVTLEKGKEQYIHRMTEAFRQIAQPITLRNNKLEIKFANVAFRELFCIDSNTSLRECADMMVPADGVDTIRNSDLLKILATQDAWQGEVVRTSRNGVQLPLYLNVSAIRDAAGNKVGYVTTYNDLSRIKKAEAGHLRALTDTIAAIGKTVEKRDPYTAGHQLRVSELASALGREFNLSENRLEGLRLGSLIHDIGKIYIPAEILSRPGRLSREEFEIIKTHPCIGAEIVDGIDFEWPISEIILQHHERLDGSGYPYGLQGDEICLEARIVAVADIVEAVVSHRPYRPGWGVDKALEIIQEQSGTGLDSDVVNACVRLFNENKFRWIVEF